MYLQYFTLPTNYNIIGKQFSKNCKALSKNLIYVDDKHDDPYLCKIVLTTYNLFKNSKNINKYLSLDT